MKNIYQITNLKNGKIYIGQTTKDVHCRWAEHIANSKRGKNNVLYKAMRKYGIDNFEVKIIEKLNEKDSLDEREIYWIKEKKSLVPNGYNMIYGGRYFKDDNPMFHEEIRKKISKYFIGNNNPAKRPEVREKIRKKALGRKISDETRKKMSINNGRYWKGRKIPQWMIEASAKKRRMMIGALNKTSKKIAMIDLKTKDVIKQFAGAAEAGRYLKIDASGISRCACGKQKSAGGYIWKYL